jgi:hypothetical protein
MKRRRTVSERVLSEEEYVAALSGIIERDFFPELEALGGRSSVPYAPEMGLDTFCATHTSEDNESFDALQMDAERARRMREAILYGPRKGSSSGKGRLEGCESSGGIRRLEDRAARDSPRRAQPRLCRPARARNTFFFAPSSSIRGGPQLGSGLRLMDAPKDVHSPPQKKTKKIVTANTRLPTDVMPRRGVPHEPRLVRGTSLKTPSSERGEPFSVRGVSRRESLAFMLDARGKRRRERSASARSGHGGSDRRLDRRHRASSASSARSFASARSVSSRSGRSHMLSPAAVRLARRLSKAKRPP